jgi:hypothetical protein
MGRSEIALPLSKDYDSLDHKAAAEDSNLSSFRGARQREPGIHAARLKALREWIPGPPPAAKFTRAA